MSETKPTLGRDYFDAIYAADPDPWGFATSAYEQGKYAVTLSALPGARYRTCLEVGCSIGVLTEMLAARCGSVLGLDVAGFAIDQARRRCATLPNVRFARMAVPCHWPAGEFDLILLSEVLYYFDAGDLLRLVQRVGVSTIPGGDIALVHWTEPTDYPFSGDGAVELFIEQMGDLAFVARGERYERFRLDILRRR